MVTALVNFYKAVGNQYWVVVPNWVPQDYLTARGLSHLREVSCFTHTSVMSVFGLRSACIKPLLLVS